MPSHIERLKQTARTMYLDDVKSSKYNTSERSSNWLYTQIRKHDVIPRGLTNEVCEALMQNPRIAAMVQQMMDEEHYEN